MAARAGFNVGLGGSAQVAAPPAVSCGYLLSWFGEDACMTNSSTCRFHSSSGYCNSLGMWRCSPVRLACWRGGSSKGSRQSKFHLHFISIFSPVFLQFHLNSIPTSALMLDMGHHQLASNHACSRPLLLLFVRSRVVAVLVLVVIIVVALALPGDRRWRGSRGRRAAGMPCRQRVQGVRFAAGAPLSPAK